MLKVAKRSRGDKRSSSCSPARRRRVDGENSEIRRPRRQGSPLIASANFWARENNTANERDPLSTVLRRTCNGRRIVQLGAVAVGPTDAGSDEEVGDTEQREARTTSRPSTFLPLEAVLVEGDPEREIKELRDNLEHCRAENRELRERLASVENQQPIIVQFERRFKPLSHWCTWIWQKHFPSGWCRDPRIMLWCRDPFFMVMMIVCIVAGLVTIVAVLGATASSRKGDDGTIIQQCCTTSAELRDLVDYLMNSDNATVAAEEVDRVYGPIEDWCVGSIQDISASLFSIDRNPRMMSSATNTSWMSFGALAFNQNISAWSMDEAVDMSEMFWKARSFNQSLASWNVSQVKFMVDKFRQTRHFDQHLSGWDVSDVEAMSGPLYDASAFNQELSLWTISHIQDTSNMFRGASSFDQDLSSWNMSHVKDTSFMFSDAPLFDQDIGSWDVSGVEA